MPTIQFHGFIAISCFRHHGKSLFGENIPEKLPEKQLIIYYHNRSGALSSIVFHEQRPLSDRALQQIFEKLSRRPSAVLRGAYTLTNLKVIGRGFRAPCTLHPAVLKTLFTNLTGLEHVSANLLTS